ncbi:MAG TPA: SGNH/GDSL hydrolase family protein [Candidatus Sulfopaludibacter sp.]|nr:SGNH/GDSL hydrolase family protein [Candidatus Sulfopaludibacter sp.]
MKKFLLVAVVFLLTAFFTAQAADPDSNLVVNGGFADGLKDWQTTGDVRLETNSPLAGKVSVIIGPGTGSLTQRVETDSGNPFTVSATLRAQRTNGWVFALRFLDQEGREIMKVDSIADIKVRGGNPQKIEHYLQPHPLTKWVEISISKDSSEGSVLVDQVGLDMPDENAAGLKPACDLDQAIQPFWLGNRVYNEAVLMVSPDGKAATGRLMFQPTRILSVKDYGWASNYVEGRDYTVDGRTLVCTAASRIPQVREQDLSKGEFKWNVVGGQQVMVTYEHGDTWNHPQPAYVGGGLPGTMKKLETQAPLTVVAYGDSITHGYGESRLSHIRPFLPPWPELFVHRLKMIYQDQHIQFYNSSQSGATSQWGKDYAERMVSSLHPDLVLIAFGQNDFWNVPADSFADNVADIMQTVRNKNPNAEFLLVSTLRFDPAYTTNSEYWNRVGEYARKLKAMTGPGVQFVDMTAISEWVYAAKKPKDCMNDPLHPNDYFARWYAQSLVAALDRASGRAPEPRKPIRWFPGKLVPTPQ